MCYACRSLYRLTIRTIITKVFIGSKKHQKALFNFNGHLGTFSGKVSLSYSIGLISSDMMHDLSIIRNIRNEFGHSHHIISFQDEKISPKCNWLKFNVTNDSKSARSKFLNAFYRIAGLFEIEIIDRVSFK